MAEEEKGANRPLRKNPWFWLLLLLLVFVVGFDAHEYTLTRHKSPPINTSRPAVKSAKVKIPPPQLDKTAYDAKLLQIANLPLLKQYLMLPNVHLGIDPEFATHNKRPGTVIGTLDASDINFAANYLAQLVRDNNLPPKILVVHRFTQPMVTNYQNITPLPEVQIVMDMDGFGGQANKLNTYKDFIADQPVQFTGFKLFYKNDNAPGKIMLTPEQILKLSPQPSYIQYQ